MNKIEKFNDFINEKLGISNDIEKLYDEIINEFKKNENKFYLKINTTYLGKKITINLFISSLSLKYQNLEGSFNVEDSDNYEFTIRISSLSKNILIHELKHLDRTIRRRMKTDSYFYISHIGRYITKSYNHLFYKKESSLFLIDILYYSNPDEFEAYYNEFYYTLKDIIDPNLDKEEKNKIIKDFLEKENIYALYKYIYYNGFNILDFFNSNKDCNFFLNEFENKMNLFYNNKDHYINNFNKFKSWINMLIGRFKNNDEKLNSKVKYINYYINKSIKNNYKKFNRLYIIL